MDTWRKRMWTAQGERDKGSTAQWGGTPKYFDSFAWEQSVQLHFCAGEVLCHGIPASALRLPGSVCLALPIFLPAMESSWIQTRLPHMVCLGWFPMFTRVINTALEGKAVWIQETWVLCDLEPFRLSIDFDFHLRKKREWITSLYCSGLLPFPANFSPNSFHCN